MSILQLKVALSLLVSIPVLWILFNEVNRFKRFKLRLAFERPRTCGQMSALLRLHDERYSCTYRPRHSELLQITTFVFDRPARRAESERFTEMLFRLISDAGSEFSRVGLVSPAAMSRKVAIRRSAELLLELLDQNRVAGYRRGISKKEDGKNALLGGLLALYLEQCNPGFKERLHERLSFYLLFWRFRKLSTQ